MSKSKDATIDGKPFDIGEYMRDISSAETETEKDLVYFYHSLPWKITHFYGGDYREFLEGLRYVRTQVENTINAGYK